MTELEDFKFTRGQRGQLAVGVRPGAARGEPLRQPAGDGRREQRIPGAHQADRGSQVLGRDVLEREAARAPE